MAAGPKKRSEDYDVVEGDHGALGLIVLAGVGCILGGTIFKVSSYKKKWRKSSKLRNYENFSVQADLSVVNLYIGNSPPIIPIWSILIYIMRANDKS